MLADARTPRTHLIVEIGVVTEYLGAAGLSEPDAVGGTCSS
jgi:hypothetical protein